MKIIGGFIVFLAFFGLSEKITFNGIVWFLVGVVLILLPELLEMFMRTQRFIHRDKK